MIVLNYQLSNRFKCLLIDNIGQSSIVEQYSNTFENLLMDLRILKDRELIVEIDDFEVPKVLMKRENMSLIENENMYLDPNIHCVLNENENECLRKIEESFRYCIEPEKMVEQFNLKRQLECVLENVYYPKRRCNETFEQNKYSFELARYILNDPAVEHLFDKFRKKRKRKPIISKLRKSERYIIRSRILLMI